MTWWAWVLVGVALWKLTAREVRLYRRNRNSSQPVRKGPKKTPAEAEARTGIEYGGTKLP